MQGDNRFYIKYLVLHIKKCTQTSQLRVNRCHSEHFCCFNIHQILQIQFWHMRVPNYPINVNCYQKKSIRNALRSKLGKRHKTYAYFSVSETPTTISVGNNMYFFRYPRALIHPMQPYF